MRADREAAKGTSAAAPGLPEPGAEARAARRVVAVYALVFAAAAALLWPRLALPYSSAEARFVHQGMRLLALTPGPDFAGGGTDGEGRALALVMLQVGCTERAVRAVVLLGLFLAGYCALEAARARSMGTAALMAALCAGVPAAWNAELVRPAWCAAAPAGLLLLALRRGGGLASLVTLALAALGAAGLARLDVPTALLAVAATALGAVFAGSWTAVARAAVAALCACLVATVLRDGFPSFAIEPRTPIEFFRSLGDTLPVALADRSYRPLDSFLVVIFVGLPALVRSLARAAHRRTAAAPNAPSSVPRIAVLAAVFAAAIASASVQTEGTYLDASRCAVALWTVALLGCAHAVETSSVAWRVVVALGAVALFAAPAYWKTPAPDRPDPRVPLAELRARAATQDAVALSGDDRAALAVYARLGDDPHLPAFYVPEESSPAAVAAAARARGARVLWTDFDASAAPGISAPPAAASSPAESRPTRWRKWVAADAPR